MRAAKLAAARQKLRDHQEKKQNNIGKDAPTHNLSVNDVTSQKPFETQLNVATTVPDHISLDSTEGNVFNFHENENTSSKDVTLASTNEQSKKEIDTHINKIDNNMQANEILIIENRKLEVQTNALRNTIEILENKLAKSVQDYDAAKNCIQRLESDFECMKNDHIKVYSELKSKDEEIAKLKDLNKSINEKFYEVSEQLDFTKTALTAKQNENDSLQSQLTNVQSQLDIVQLHLQQLTNGNEPTATQDPKNIEHLTEQNKFLLQKNSSLEQKLKVMENEYDQRVTHYEQYVNQLNEQLKDILSKSSQLSLENENLANREASLVAQIIDMEKLMQNLRGGYEKIQANIKSEEDSIQTQKKCLYLEEKWKQLKLDYDKLQNELKEASTEIQELKDKLHQAESLNNNLDLSKLNADMTSDKVAAQRAITQNNQLKKEIEDLREVYVKMSKDKLELVEKLDAEKFLNRELTIKLAEIEDKSNDLMPKLMAKDNEMIRLQAHCSKMEKELEDQKQQINSLLQQIVLYKTELEKAQETTVMANAKLSKLQKSDSPNDSTTLQNNESEPNVIKCEHRITASSHGENDLTMLSIEDAMLKLQERFLNKMKEVADLSDEKQKLEHIVMQLQNETDTICEYVALYQQQRGILRRREEERNAQIKFFEAERERMRAQLEGLANIITKLSEDNKLQKLLQDESKKEDIFKIYRLITNIKNNHFMNPNKQYIELEEFHPCAWCSGKLIDV